MNRGFVSLWRKSFESAVWTDPNLWRLWTACLMLASHKEHWIKVDGLAEPVRVGPGQFITGRNSLHRILFPRKRKGTPSPVTIWRWLQTLEKLENLNIKTCKRFSIVSINNWGCYQVQQNQNVQANDPPVFKRCATDVHKQKCLIMDNNISPPVSPPRGKTKNPVKTTAPDLFPITEQMRTYAEAKCYQGSLESLTEHFLDHHRAKGSKFADWASAWKTWLRNAVKFQGERGGSPQPPDPGTADLPEWKAVQ